MYFCVQFCKILKTHWKRVLKSNQKADCLSRNSVHEYYENTYEVLKVLNLSNLEDIKEWSEYKYWSSE